MVRRVRILYQIGVKIMINIWEFQYAGRIKIVDIDDKEFIGDAQEVTEAEEQSDLDRQEDSITIYTDDGRLIDFYASEIKTIEKIA